MDEASRVDWEMKPAGPFFCVLPVTVTPNWTCGRDRALTHLALGGSAPDNAGS